MVQAIPTIPDLYGLWRRSLIAWPNGLADTTTSVRWLQGLCTYLDLRQPADLPAFPARRGLRDLSIDDCAWLARQEAFAGRFTFDGSDFEWARAIDFQPKALYSDVGSLCWDGNVLVERGRDIAYVEHWHRDAAVPMQPIAALELRERSLGLKGALLRVGPHFMVARDRVLVPPLHQTLVECVAGAVSLAQAQALVDCEISFGRVSSAGFLISASTLPFRVGDRLDPQIRGEALTIRDRTAEGDPTERHWLITAAEGDLGRLASHTALGDGAEETVG